MSDLLPKIQPLNPPLGVHEKLANQPAKVLFDDTTKADQSQTITPPLSPKKKPLPSLDVVMNSLSHLDRTGPLTATAGSPFMVSPVIGATLLTSAAMLAKNAEPPLMSPSSPIVWHPISLSKASSLMASTGTSSLQAQAKNYEKILFEGQIRPVAVAAFEDLLFLTRIAKWKVAYHEGLPFNRSEQLPYCESFSSTQNSTN